ncbi:hypothetical protein LX36DRAFT_660669 [Colletotrichum falcatum]|nr:hypothetical protein LX36DRAFT_660669 [Colletotrichum falcatum]
MLKLTCGWRWWLVPGIGEGCGPFAEAQAAASRRTAHRWRFLGTPAPKRLSDLGSIRVSVDMGSDQSTLRSTRHGFNDGEGKGVWTDFALVDDIVTEGSERENRETPSMVLMGLDGNGASTSSPLFLSRRVF